MDAELTPETLRAYGRHIRNRIYRGGNRSGRDILYAHADAWAADRARLGALEWAANDFVARVDNGKARSTDSYAKFKKALAAQEGRNG